MANLPCYREHRIQPGDSASLVGVERNHLIQYGYDDEMLSRIFGRSLAQYNGLHSNFKRGVAEDLQV